MFDYNNPIVQNDLEKTCRASIPWFNLNGKCFLITGANGMIATYMVYTLMYLTQKYEADIKVIALSRNKQKAEELFGDFLNDSHFTLLLQDVCEPVYYAGNVDYIFHFAGNASPYYIQNDPVGIMKSNLLGTINILEMAREKETEKVIFASTREVYGKNDTDNILSENSFGYIDCLDDRSCYPESKRAAESLCRSYYLQYGVNFNTVRIAHTYGPGMKLGNDGRVMADLIKCVIEDQDITLKSTGESLRAFCYVTDSITGLFHILLYGKEAEAYNLANEAEEISIRSLAEMLIKVHPEKNLQLKFQMSEVQSAAYCNYQRVKLDTRKTESLAWMPVISLEEGIIRTIKSFEM
jgi:nucleoside-diphosphate-sugar epimerase